jgi:His-Xaa-Ser system protein HxsD
MTVDVVVDPGVYPIEAVMASAYVFVDRCYVLLDKLPDGRIKVALTAKAGTSDAQLAAVSGEFQNELLAQALRREVASRHEHVREAIIARALFGAAPLVDGAPAEPPGLDPRFLPAEDDDYLEDPLGIAVPWEEKYGQAPAAEVAAPAAPAPPDGGGSGK